MLGILCTFSHCHRVRNPVLLSYFSSPSTARICSPPPLLLLSIILENCLLRLLVHLRILLLFLLAVRIGTARRLHCPIFLPLSPHKFALRFLCYYLLLLLKNALRDYLFTLLLFCLLRELEGMYKYF